MRPAGSIRCVAAAAGLLAAVAAGDAFAADALAAQGPAAAPAPMQAPAQAPAPLGVFGADMPAKGKVVISLAPQFTRQQGILIGDMSVKPAYLVTHVVSAYTPQGTSLLRLAPQNLTSETQTLSVAYGLTADTTLLAAIGASEKSVNMQAFQGQSGTTSLGYKVGATLGLSDTALAVIHRVYHDPVNRLNLSLGLSLPTGRTTEMFSLLLPNNTAPPRRGFYGMQPGSGTDDLMPGATYSGVRAAWSWGLSYRARLPLDKSDQGWRYGDLHELNGWAGYTWIPGLETTLRVNATSQTAIHGADAQIRGYAQAANPNFYGGEQVSLYAGAIVAGRFVGLNAASLGLEAGVPVYQRLNGPQLARDWQVNLALRYRL